MNARCWPLLAVFACALAQPVCAYGQADRQVLRVAVHSNLVILDPIWTTAYIARNHGYLIYDTLFGMDAKGGIHPQMVDKWEVSKDRKTWTFTLRDGLEFHDGKPVESEDVIASLSRWSKRDAMGQKLMEFVEAIESVGPRTFRLKLKEPYGLVLESLGKPSSNVPFIMPRRVAATPADKQIDDYTGSGPFVFVKDEWKPGEKLVYRKNAKYRPRSEDPSGTAGGKIVRVERVEWLIIKDPQTQINALAAGEIDIVEDTPFEHYGSLKANPNVQIVVVNPGGWSNFLRFNHLQPPFDNPKVRRAAMAALNQPAFLRVQVGVPELYRTCFSVYPCGSLNATEKGMEFIARPDMKRAQQLLKDSGYDGTPVVLLHPTDVVVISRLPVVAAQLLRQAGFKVDIQSMDWQTLVARRVKKEVPGKGGWNMFLSNAVSVAHLNPISANVMNASCDKAWFGWPCDAELEKRRDAYARADNDTDRKALAEQIQVRAMEIGTHVPLGEYVVTGAARKNVKGFVIGYFLVYWNIEKQ
jgi:peptide/nickel transport system substrate-binding protein